ncbi:glycosyltransferase [Sphingobacterium faecale]|uniref:Glycosyltransferase n=1 Tax=Sphingobacterium faecale TaxID=2803775 RepID=A0ABS1QZ22_9SPHI|nr:glycosyltransferase [Sphingobacterium faecale]MBL1407676.1 glycosyltransferase [Sphingobacterium faecale]
MFFSLIIPLYNRPEEIEELLSTLTKQTFKDFEVVIVEDGSTRPAKDVIARFEGVLDVHYFEKKNEGQGFARNYGFERARGTYFIVFDSDILVPSEYLSVIKEALDRERWDAFGGPDAAHESFTPIQKAISYSMTSPFTTGGIRGNKKHVGQFHPRSFNMGISREVWKKTGGYKLSRRSEDIEFSIRMINSGFKVGLVPEAFVYHKRRTSLPQFFKQIYNFGKGRIDIAQIYPRELKPVHALPALFTIGIIGLLVLNVVDILLFGDAVVLHYMVWGGNIFLLSFITLLLLHSSLKTKSLKVGLWSVVTAFTQLMAYGFGFIGNYIDRVLLRKDTSC